MLKTGALLMGIVACGCSRMPDTKMVAVEPAPERVACAADADCGGLQLCVERACYDVATATACTENPVHFATNRADVDSRNRPELNQLAACLRSNHDVRINVAGNADERGDRDANRALAQRRADTVAAYLQSAGVPTAQLSTVTYGVDNPLCAEHDAACWRQNRRVDIAASNLGNGNAPRNKVTSDDDTTKGQRIDSTGSGTDNGSPLGK